MCWRENVYQLVFSYCSLNVLGPCEVGKKTFWSFSGLFVFCQFVQMTYLLEKVGCLITYCDCDCVNLSLIPLMFVTRLGGPEFGVYMSSIVIFFWLVDALIRMKYHSQSCWLVSVWNYFFLLLDYTWTSIRRASLFASLFHLLGILFPFLSRWYLSLKLRFFFVDNM